MAGPLSYFPKAMDAFVMRMKNQEDGGLRIRDVQNFLTRVPSVFTGAEVIEWVEQNAGEALEEGESQHLCHMIASHGYIFPLYDPILTVKNDGTYYRFQTKCFWLSRCNEIEPTDYALYLYKRALQSRSRPKDALSDYEHQNLTNLKATYAGKWQHICWQAECQLKIDKKRGKREKKIMDSQERAFWDLHRPAPGCVDVTEVDKRKLNRLKPKNTAHIIPGCPIIKGTAEESLRNQIAFLKNQLERRRQKQSKVCESLKSYWEMYSEFDPMISSPEQGNPWIVENQDFWESDCSNALVPERRYKRWVFSILDLLKDHAGQTEFHKFLQKEISAENLEFWLACRKLKSLPNSKIHHQVAEIFVEYLAEGAKNSINVDAHVADTVGSNVVNNPSRYTFDSAEEHIFNLMKNDSYTRYIRSEEYKEYVKMMAAAAFRARSMTTKITHLIVGRLDHRQ